MTRFEASVLRIATAGSVDDGKSTLIGRLLYESKAILDDQLEALQNRKKQDGVLDLSLVTDGLKSEREQGITIDVAYKYFATSKRKFILADAPGHVQYTRNMVTAASRADAAIILVDARLGILEQTRRHAYLVHLLAVPHIILAINKIDLIDFDAERIQAIEAEFRELAWNTAPRSLHVVPISALQGINISQRSERTPCYDGPALLEILEGLPSEKAVEKPAELGIQLVLRSAEGRRFAAGTLNEGRIRVGDAIRMLPSDVTSKVSEMWVGGIRKNAAYSGDAVSLGFEDERDLERGQLITALDKNVASTRSFRAKLVWFDDEPFRQEERYLLKLGTQTTRASVEQIDFRFDLPTLSEVSAQKVERNDIVQVRLHSARALYLSPFMSNKRSGAFILIDPRSFRTVAAGLVEDLLDERTQGHTGGRFLVVDSFASPKQELLPPLGLRISADLLAVNSFDAQILWIETLLDLGWTLWIEDGAQADRVRQRLDAKGYGSYEHGLGI